MKKVTHTLADGTTIVNYYLNDVLLHTIITKPETLKLNTNG